MKKILLAGVISLLPFTAFAQDAPKLAYGNASLDCPDSRKLSAEQADSFIKNEKEFAMFINEEVDVKEGKYLIIASFNPERKTVLFVRVEFKDSTSPPVSGCVLAEGQANAELGSVVQHEVQRLQAYEENLHSNKPKENEPVTKPQKPDDSNKDEE